MESDAADGCGVQLVRTFLGSFMNASDTSSPCGRETGRGITVGTVRL